MSGAGRPPEAGFALQEWQIRLVLPHRPPVLQLDHVADCLPARGMLQGTKFLAGGDPMLARRADATGATAMMAPGALIEALAQCCGLLVRLRWLADRGADLAAFAAGDAAALRGLDIPRSVLAESRARFAAPVPPGRTLRLTARLALSRGDIHRFDTAVTCAADVPAVGAEIVLKFPFAQ